MPRDGGNCDAVVTVAVVFDSSLDFFSLVIYPDRLGLHKSPGGRIFVAAFFFIIQACMGRRLKKFTKK